MVARHGLVVLALAGAFAGCAQSASFTGHSGTCRYGLGAGASGLGCYHRAGPSNDLEHQAMSPGTLARALVAWRDSHGTGVVASVGINWWAETTFALDKHDLTTFDVHGRATKDNDGYVSSARVAFPVSAVRPDVFGRLVAAIRAGQPDTVLNRAVLNVDPFSNVVVWRFVVVSPKVDSDVLYRAASDGSELCHGTDYAPHDALVPAAGVPACPDGILPF